MAAEGALARLGRAEGRALRLRCPRCGRAPLFRGWFTMNTVCAVRDLRFERAPGYWIGAIYVNYRGTLSATVKSDGPPPKPEPLAVNKNRDVCGEQKASEALVVGPERGVRGSVILLEGVARGKKGEADVVLDNHRCVFVHHVTVTMPGERARVKNSDPILHNTHGFLGKATVFNLA